MKILVSVIFLIGLFAVAKEERKVITIVDTGVNLTPKLKPFLCEGGRVDATGTGNEDRIGHGTIIFSLIAEQIQSDAACITMIKWCDHDCPIAITSYLEALKKVPPTTQYLNLSLGGRSQFESEKILIETLVGKKAHVVVAAGNDGADLSVLCWYYPACYKLDAKYFHVVGSLDKEGNRLESSNYGLPEMCYYDGTTSTHMKGTSFSAARATGDLVKKDLK